MKTVRIIIDALADLRGNPTEPRHFIMEFLGGAFMWAGFIAAYIMAYGLEGGV